MKATLNRPSGRSPNSLREVQFERNFTCHAEGSVLVSYGQTKVVCTATVSSSVPAFLKGSGRGWMTAEYGMLPRSTHSRMDREAVRGRQSGRTVEIQRLIGRSLRSALNLSLLGERTLILDCDVIQADGGTRTASISGACVAVVDAMNSLQRTGQLQSSPLKYLISAVSVGMWKGIPIVDLDYAEDAKADSDISVVMSAEGDLVEVQGTAEGVTFNRTEFDVLLDLAFDAGRKINFAQRAVLSSG